MRLIEVERQLVQGEFFDAEGPDFADVLPDRDRESIKESQILEENRVIQ